MPTQVYTTLTRLQKRLSSDGLELRQDDDPSAYLQFIDDVSDEIEFYCAVRYTPAVLVTSGWVLKVATDLLVWMYAWRRLNGVPEGVQKMYEWAIERLEKIQMGQLKIPGLATSKDAAPALSNIRPRLRPVPRPVVVEGTSTGTAEDYTRHTDRYDQWIDYTI